MHVKQWPDLIPSLEPWISDVRGQLVPNQPLDEMTTLRVGGPAQLLFRPVDEADLAFFLKHLPADIRVTVIGVGSNLLIRDGGLDGVVIKLPPIGQPGYKWQVFWLDLRYLRQLAEIEADGGPDDPSTARFIALRLTNNRATIIRFLALREGAGKEDQPVAMLEVGVTVQDEGDTDALTATPPP